MWKKFTFKVIVFTGLVVLFIGAFNWAVDPLDIFGSPKIEGFNANKPEVDVFQRQYKARKMTNQKPNILILGTSRTDRGIDPSNKTFTKSIFNTSMNSVTPIECEYIVNNSIQNGTKHIIFGVDLFTFYAKQLKREGFSEEIFYETYPTEYIISRDVLKNSLKTIYYQTKPNPYLASGLKSPLWLENEKNEFAGYKGNFIKEEKGYFTVNYTKEFSKTQTAHWKAFERILDKAYKNNIKITLFISPSHARQWEVLAITQGWGMFEEYRKRLMTVNEKVALENNKQPFALWDFAGYHPLTTEEVPNDPKAKMNWYWDSSHYKKELGDIVLDRMFDGNFSGGQNYPDFGVKLTKENIESHLVKLRTQREIWRKTHPKDVFDIKALKINK